MQNTDHAKNLFFTKIKILMRDSNSNTFQQFKNTNTTFAKNDLHEFNLSDMTSIVDRNAFKQICRVRGGIQIFDNVSFAVRIEVRV